jgi:hypothetical protein
MQHGTFEVKSVFLHVTKHFFDPHASFVEAKCDSFVRKVGCQAPGFFFTNFPMDKQVDRIDFRLCQISLSEPDTLACFLDVRTKGLPFMLGFDSNTSV